MRTTDKKVLFYTGWKWLFKPLSYEEKGYLIEAMIKLYEDEAPDVSGNSESLQIAFGYISAQIERDRERAKCISQMRRKAGRKSARLRKSKQEKP